MNKNRGRKTSAEERPDHPFGVVLKELLNRRGKTQFELAQASTLDLATLNKMIKGKRLVGSMLRDRLLQLIEGLQTLGVLHELGEANRLLATIPTVGPLDSRSEREAALIARLIQTSISPPAPPANPASAVLAGDLPPFPALFVGRQADLTALNERLQGYYAEARTPGQARLIVRGWPGVGKSTIASVVAYEAYNGGLARYFPDGVLWASLGQFSNPLTTLVKWGLALGLNNIINSKSAAEAARQLQGRLADKRLLVVLDDVWEEAAIETLLVGGSRCATLITTRLPLVANNLAPREEDIYVLHELSEDAALELLNLLAFSAVRHYAEDARRLVSAIECLPLALQVAGRLLRLEASHGLSVKKLLADLTEGSFLLKSTVPTEFSRQVSPTIELLLRKSTDYLDPVSRRCFVYLAAFAAETSPLRV